MKIFIYTVTVFFLLIGLTSCEDIIDPNNLIKNNESLVVINSFISPQDTIISVKVSKTKFIIGQPIFDSNSDEKFSIKDAKVLLTNEAGESISLPYSEKDFRYQIQAKYFSVKADKKYFLKVIVNEKEFKASCKIPAKRIINISEVLLEREDEEDGRTQNIKVRFEDIKSQKNYYIVGAEYQIVSKNFVQRSPFDFDSERFVTDFLGDGKEMSSEGKFKIDFFSGNQIEIQVANVEKDLYETLLSLYRNGKNEGSPLQEFVIPPNNIKGDEGYGVFAGFQITKKTIIL